MPKQAPKLSWSGLVEDFLAKYDDPMGAVRTLFSLLADPEVDGRVKFDVSGFPFRTPMRALLDDSWYVTYSVDYEGNVKVHQMKRRADVDHIRRQLDQAPD